MPFLHPENGVPKMPPPLPLPIDALRSDLPLQDNSLRIIESATPTKVIAANEYVLRTCPARSFTRSARAIDGCLSSTDYSDYGEDDSANQMIERIKFWMMLTFFQRHVFCVIKSTGTRENVSLFDLGAGAGCIVTNRRSSGIETYGVEPSARLGEFALRVFALEIFPSIEVLNGANAL